MLARQKTEFCSHHTVKIAYCFRILKLEMGFDLMPKIYEGILRPRSHFPKSRKVDTVICKKEYALRQAASFQVMVRANAPHIATVRDWGTLCLHQGGTYVLNV